MSILRDAFYGFVGFMVLICGYIGEENIVWSELKGNLLLGELLLARLEAVLEEYGYYNIRIPASEVELAIELGRRYNKMTSAVIEEDKQGFRNGADQFFMFCDLAGPQLP